MNKRCVRAAFESTLQTLPFASLLPTRQITDLVRRSPRYRCIAASLDEVGLVEPLVVYREADHRGRYLLLDGHLRRSILMERGETKVDCLFAKDDEAYTYNKRINRLSVVQQHFMIVRAIERGVPESKLARALDVKIDYINQRKRLLRNICVEAVQMLRDAAVNPVVFDVLRKMRPTRQIETCELMASAGSYTSAYARALLVATKDCDLVKPVKPSARPRISSADLSLLERELKTAQEDFRAVEAAYGNDMLNLVIATRYISQLLGNERIGRYLDENHPEILAEFGRIVDAADSSCTMNDSVDADV
ncbi:MAG: ParB N-terminal domain-containing protein [Bradyrhizobium sp.]|uniref:plasmid partitioning protein RepB C-terminal domain-containing protein n=1 Tax=Bradyrhizobium sp. TaxID=376 RepID=UPI001DA0EBC0|nr:plasmid partitioning protein RepB C-terminal domain-containing protein [Bradyrhizobium sp.]MBV9559204.1 ParB N-terminal domain-containing protein [Bradyrhizobium sp.]